MPSSSATVAPAPPTPTDDVFREAKESMSLAALTYDNDYPITPEHRKVLTAGSDLDKEFNRTAAETYRTPSKLITGEVCRSDNRILVRIKGEIKGAPQPSRWIHGWSK
jgi:hypothetical protein